MVSLVAKSMLIRHKMISVVVTERFLGQCTHQKSFLKALLMRQGVKNARDCRWRNDRSTCIAANSALQQLALWSLCSARSQNKHH